MARLRGPLSRRATALAGALLMASPAGTLAHCQGKDLFPEIALAAPSAFSAIEDEAQKMPFGHGKLFRLSRQGESPSYIFGTLHLADPSLLAMPAPLEAALSGAKTVALETLETGNSLAGASATKRAALQALLLARGKDRPDRLLSIPDQAKLEAQVKRQGLPESAARRFKPAVLALLLDQPACEHGARASPSLDERIKEMARDKAIPTQGLETVAELVTSVDGLSPEASRALLIAILQQAPHLEDIAATMIARYQAGEIGALLAWMRSSAFIPGVPAAGIPREFLDRLIGRRNQRMRERILPLLRRGGAFIAVGAAHLPGEDGLLYLLAQDGYQIETVE